MIKRSFFAVTFLCGSLQAMVFDNRFLPLYFKPHTRRCDAPYWIRIQPFFMQADRAFSDDKHANIPDIDGSYDQIALANALVSRGRENPLRSDFQLRTTLPWTRRGRLNAQGISVYFEQPVGCYTALGVGTVFGSVNVRHEFLLRGAELLLPEGDRDYLYQVKEKMHEELGITPAFYKHTGFGDVDCYVRFGTAFDYTLKCRRLDPTLKFGFLVPTQSRTPCNNPAAVPLGGQGHWGVYGAVEFETECKEDLIVGFNFRAIKRFKKSYPIRIPLAGEPSSYGASVALVTVDPGWTFVANPYFSFEGLREGFGLKVQYTLVSHQKDFLTDKSIVDVPRSRTAALNCIRERSSWGTEHVTIGAFYDFGKIRECPNLYPKLSAYWDIPVDWLVSKRAAKTNCVSLMLELDF
ncbi:hypothetical protein H0X06_06565 [Candidatus Dependentiae bacterium]|nr:hypothetical protein [Candidatus Dependentiae bacterium]